MVLSKVNCFFSCRSRIFSSIVWSATNLTTSTFLSCPRPAKSLVICGREAKAPQSLCTKTKNLLETRKPLEPLKLPDWVCKQKNLLNNHEFDPKNDEPAGRLAAPSLGSTMDPSSKLCLPLAGLVLHLLLAKKSTEHESLLQCEIFEWYVPESSGESCQQWLHCRCLLAQGNGCKAPESVRMMKRPEICVAANADLKALKVALGSLQRGL